MTTTVRSLFASNVSGTFFDSSTQLQLDSINATIDLSAISSYDTRHSHVDAPAVIAESFVDVCGRVDTRTYNRNGSLAFQRYHSDWNEFITDTCPDSLNVPSLFDEIGVVIDPNSKLNDFAFTPSDPTPRDEVFEKVQNDVAIEMASGKPPRFHFYDKMETIPEYNRRVGKDRADANIGRRKLDTTSNKTDEKETACSYLFCCCYFYSWRFPCFCIYFYFCCCWRSTCSFADTGERYRYISSACQELLVSSRFVCACRTSSYSDARERCGLGQSFRC